MGLAHEKKSYLQEKANLFEIGSVNYFTGITIHAQHFPHRISGFVGIHRHGHPPALLA